QTFEDIEGLPALRAPPLEGDPDTIPWPDGDLVEEKPLPEGVDADALEAMGEWAFERETHGHPSQITLSLLVVHDGDVVYERYATGVDVSTRTRTWSTAKSIAATLLGIAVGDGLLELDEPLPVTWAPDELNEMHARVRSRMPLVSVDSWPPPAYEKAADPRRAITLRHVLNMSSGLYPVDNEYGGSIGSPMAYSAGWSSARQAVDRGLVREPGTVWDYENYDTLLGVLAMREALGAEAYLEFPRRALLDRIGMRSTVPGVDRFGDYVLSSQVYTNARDLARLGLLYLNRGVWNGERIFPEWWADFVRTPAPSTRAFGGFYGGGFWLVPDARTDIPQDAYTTAGARGQYTVIVPSYDLVIVRRGLDGPGPGFPTWDMVAEVLKAFPEWEGGTKGGR
ncbi:MAG: beta-lactamase family protein, partial [Gemmatimonadetes bacterium]|nr:beta-lactamase family protein [Gemmatimonadota bacterium]